MKLLDFSGREIQIAAPENINFANQFDYELYSLIYSQIKSGSEYSPVIDTDILFSGGYGINVRESFYQLGLRLNKTPQSNAANPERWETQFIVRQFLTDYPILLGLVANNVSLPSLSIKCAEILSGLEVSGNTFIKIKAVTDAINRIVWTREKDLNERQSGVSTLGSISEDLLNSIFDSITDDVNFFKVGNNSVNSYGDFVLMCLPNNLWLSVKSNFARERLLASGYSNDILGVGYFQDAKEFTSLTRIRNFQRAGFLAMYCPDLPISEKQISDNTNTYKEIVTYYKEQDITFPLNINGQPFIRKLSDLFNDLSKLLQEQDIKKRTTVSF